MSNAVQQNIFISIAGKNINPVYDRKSNKVNGIRLLKFVLGTHVCKGATSIDCKYYLSTVKASLACLLLCYAKITALHSLLIDQHKSEDLRQRVFYLKFVDSL